MSGFNTKKKHPLQLRQEEDYIAFAGMPTPHDKIYCTFRNTPRPSIKQQHTLLTSTAPEMTAVVKKLINKNFSEDLRGHMEQIEFTECHKWQHLPILVQYKIFSHQPNPFIIIEKFRERIQPLCPNYRFSISFISYTICLGFNTKWNFFLIS